MANRIVKENLDKLRSSNTSLTDDVKKLQDVVYSSNYGLPKKFIDKNSDLVLKSNRAVSEILASYGINGFSSGSNSLQDLASLVSSSIRYRSKSNTLRSATSQGYGVGDEYTDLETGIKDISPMGNIDQDEHDIISQASMLYQSFMKTVPEYRGVVDLIPQVKRAIENVARDILSVSDLSGRILNKIYAEDSSTGSISSQDKSRINIVNKLIQEEIIDKNHLEDKLKKWVYESLVCGVKPIAIIPYSYIIRQLNNLNNSDPELKLNVNKFNASIKSGESYKICETKDQENKFNRISVESGMIDMVDRNKSKDPVMSAESMFDSLLDDDLVEQFAISCESDFNVNYNTLNAKIHKLNDDQIKYEHIHGVKSQEAIQQLELLEAATKNFKEKKEKLETQKQEDRIAEARKGLKELARYIDDHIDVVKPGASSAYIVNKITNQKDRYSSFYNLGENYYMAEGLKKKTKVSKDKNNGEVANALDLDDDSELGKDCIIIPYSAESIIPININGEYMGFYCLEYENTSGPLYKQQKKTGSFTDYIKNQGYGDDGALLGGSGPNISWGGADPLDNNLYSPLALYNYSVNNYLYGGQDQQDARFDIMKTVVLRVLAHRLRDPDLADNKLFKDAVMSMLRNDVLTRRKVQFTFIPPEYMIYMTYKTDDDGVPKSILDGTLLFAYMYIASTMSSVMIKLLKSSDKEKYTVNIGLQKNAGYSIDELQRCLSTRDVYTDSMFGSLASVIKNAGAYQRLIIPVVNGNKLYDVEQIETVNNVSPDDELTGKLLESILNKIGINAGMQSNLDSADFAHEYTYKNIEYHDSIVSSQHNYENFIKDILRALVSYSPLDTYNSKTDILFPKNQRPKRDDGDIDISRIKPELSAPTMLSMTNISEVLDAAKNVANSITEVMNLNEGSPIETARNTLFKRKIIEKYADIVEWNDIENILREAESEAPKEVAHNQKLSKIDAKMQEDDPNNGGGGDAGMSDADMGGGDFGGEAGDNAFGGGGGEGSADAF